MLWPDWLAADWYRGHVMPYYYHVLFPGDGLVIPSRSFHSVSASNDRISVQIFYEPKFDRMRWPTNHDSHWHRETRTRRAVRNLFFRTIARLWDERRIGL